jgi:hypothetical protein
VASLHDDDDDDDDNNNNNYYYYYYFDFLLAENAKNIHHTTNKAIYSRDFGVQQPSLISP